VLKLTLFPMPPLTDATGYQRVVRETQMIETRRRHMIELVVKALEAVQVLKARLDTECWDRGSTQWNAAAMLIEKRQYQRALDSLEGLIVARMFKLRKVNMAGTGGS
jgi:hypothetical protein